MNVLKLPKDRLEKIILEEIQRFRLEEQALSPDQIKAQITEKVDGITDPNKLAEINTLIDTALQDETGI